jgi:hypothetical protein
MDARPAWIDANRWAAPLTVIASDERQAAGDLIISV